MKKSRYVCQMWGDSVVLFSTEEDALKYAKEQGEICLYVQKLTYDSDKIADQNFYENFKDGEWYGMYPFFDALKPKEE